MTLIRLVILSAIAWIMAAQGPRPPVFPGKPVNPSRNVATFEALTQALALTNAQAQQLLALQQDKLAARQAIYQQVSDKQRQLNDALNSENADPTSIGRLELEMARLRKQIGSPDSIRDQALALLDESQKAKLTDLQNALRLQKAANEAVGLGLISGPSAVAPVGALRQ